MELRRVAEGFGKGIKEGAVVTLGLTFIPNSKPPTFGRRLRTRIQNNTVYSLMTQARVLARAELRKLLRMLSFLPWFALERCLSGGAFPSDGLFYGGTALSNSYFMEKVPDSVKVISISNISFTTVEQTPWSICRTEHLSRRKNQTPHAPLYNSRTDETTDVCSSLLCVPVFVKHSGRSGKNEIYAWW